MPIKKVAAMLHSREGEKPLTAREVALQHRISPQQARVELERLVDLGIAEKLGKGQYFMKDRELAEEYVGKQKKTFDGRGDGKAPFVRPHNLQFYAPVLNDVEPGPGWDYHVASGTRMYGLEVVLPGCGVRANIRYSRGKRKGSLYVQLHGVLLPGNCLEAYYKVVKEALEEVLNDVAREEGMRFSYIKPIGEGHIAFPLGGLAVRGYQLPAAGTVIKDGRWWYDESCGFTELETDSVERAERLVNLPDVVDSLKEDMKSLRKDLVIGSYAEGTATFWEGMYQ